MRFEFGLDGFLNTRHASIVPIADTPSAIRYSARAISNPKSPNPRAVHTTGAARVFETDARDLRIDEYENAAVGEFTHLQIDSGLWPVYNAGAFELITRCKLSPIVESQDEVVTKPVRKSLGRRAIIAGGSLGGMLAARAVAPHFVEVVVLERDVFTDSPAPRRTTPQSHHVHMLLKGGENAIDRILPGFRGAIEDGGSVTIRAGLDFLAGSELGFAPRWDAGMELHGQSRWMLEHCIRQRVLTSTPLVELRTGCTVRALKFDAPSNRITGVKVESQGGTSDLDADLVIDATGRGEGGLRWLSALGVPLPEVEEVTVDFGYSSAIVELPDDPARDWKALAMGNLPRVGARGAVLLPIEGGRFICSLGGRAGDYPPDNEAEFLEFAKSLPHESVPVMETWTSPMWHRASVFLFALCCFAAEWGLRRWRGLA